MKTFANFADLLLCAKILFANTVSFPDLSSPFVPRPCTYARPRFDTWKLVKYGVVRSTTSCRLFLCYRSPMVLSRSSRITRHVLDSFPGSSLMRAPSTYKAWLIRTCHPRNFYSRNTLVSAIREKFHPRNKPAIRYMEVLILGVILLISTLFLLL